MSYKSPSHCSNSSPYSPASETSSNNDAPKRMSLLQSMQRPEHTARSESPSYIYQPPRSIQSGSYIQSFREGHNRRPSSTNSHSNTGMLPMKAMIKETERYRREQSVEETKANLVKALSKVDEKIDQVEKEIKAALRKKERLEREEREHKHVGKSEERDDYIEEIDLEPWQEIYAKNRRQVALTHKKFDSIHLLKTENGVVRKDIFPQYNQALDSGYIQKLQVEMAEFRPKLLAYVAHKKKLAFVREGVLSKKYDQDLKKWNERVEKWNRSPKKRIRDAKSREVFERMFPELKRHRENQERLKRTANREHTRSEAELKERVLKILRI